MRQTQVGLLFVLLALVTQALLAEVPTFPAPELAEEMVTVELQEPYNGFKTGGAGRYLVFSKTDSCPSQKLRPPYSTTTCVIWEDRDLTSG